MFVFCGIRYAEYGLARVQNIAYAALQNAAGNYVRPDQVLAANATDIFGSDFVIPNSTANPGWANVSLMTSSALTCAPLMQYDSHTVTPSFFITFIISSSAHLISCVTD